MGLGLAPMEEAQFDARSARMINPCLAGHHVRVHMDMPDIDITAPTFPTILDKLL